MSKAEQVRQLLSSYYGEYEEEDDSLHTMQPGPSAPPPRAAPSLLITPAASKMLSNVKAVGIDSTAFDPSAFVGALQREHGLAALLHKFTQVRVAAV